MAVTDDGRFARGGKAGLTDASLPHVGHVETVVVGPISTNCYLIDDGEGGLVIVDPGAQPCAILRAVGDRPVRLILVTHFHDDHVGALNELVDKAGAPWVIGEPDARMLDGSVPRSASYVPVPAATPPQRLLHDGDVVEAGLLRFDVIACPGHTVGGVTYHDAAHGQAFVGDTLFHGSYGRCDLMGGDESAMMGSLARLAQLPPETRVYSGHGPSSTIADEQSGNRFVRMAMRR